MAGIFKVNEVVEIAVEIERRGEAFYRQMAAKAQDRGIVEVLDFLASEEARHQRFFRDLLARLDPLQLPPGSDEDEYWAYVNDLIDSHFLFDDAISQRLVSSAASDAEVLHLAMGFEKESILFFTELKGLIPPSEVQTLEACIQEERRHLRRLAERLKVSS